MCVKSKLEELHTHLCPCSKSKYLTYIWSIKSDRSTLLHWLVLSIELGIVQTRTGKVDMARKLKCTTAARVQSYFRSKTLLITAKYSCTCVHNSRINFQRLVFIISKVFVLDDVISHEVYWTLLSSLRCSLTSWS